MQQLLAARFVPVMFLAFLFLAVTPKAAPAADNGFSIGSSIVILGASVTAPSGSTRTLNSNHAAAFMQTWLPTSIFGNIANENPPKSLPVSHLSVRYTYAGTSENPMVVYYASDGHTAWVGMPPQSLWFGASVTSERWIRAPDSAKTMAAFEGKLAAIPVPGSGTSTTTPTAAPDAANHSSGGGGTSSATWALIGAGIVIAAAAVVGALRLRGRSARKPA